MCQTSLAEPVKKKLCCSRAIASQTQSCLIPWTQTELAIQWKLYHSRPPTWKAMKLKTQTTANYCNPMKKLIKKNRMPTCKWCRTCLQKRQKWLRSGIKNWTASMTRWSRITFFTSRSTSLTLVCRTLRKSGSLSLWTLFSRRRIKKCSMRISDCRSITCLMRASDRASTRASIKSTVKACEARFGNWSAKCTNLSHSTSEVSFGSLLSKRILASRIKLGKTCKERSQATKSSNSR